MCAAKLERTGFVFRNVWPNVKRTFAEQPTTFAQASNESGFVRKNSQKAEVAATGHSARTPIPVVQRRCHATRSRLAPRQLTSNLLHASQPRGIATTPVTQLASFGPVVSRLSGATPGSATSAAAAAADAEIAGPQSEQRLKCGVSIDELVRTASEKYDLNTAFWGRYENIPSMALASEKQDILQITENFALIHRKHIYLFQRLKNTVLRTLDLWSAPDFAALCHSWAQLGFLHEDLCVAMAERVTSTAYTCNTQELCWLMDAYATARCSVHSVVTEITKQTLLRLEEFTLSQLCLHASSFARLNIRNAQLFSSIAERLEQAPLVSDLDAPPAYMYSLSARDLTLAAYSFAKLGFYTPSVFETVSRAALPVVRDFTARDLQMLTVALVRAKHRDPELLEALSAQAQRRIAQFSSESMALMLRAMAFFDRREDLLFTRALAQLPRAILTFRPADVTTFLGAFAAAQVHSPALFDVVTPFIMEKAPMFTPSDWLLALRSYSSLGHKDPTFLSALGLHLEASKLSLPQLGAALADCSRLSFSGVSGALAEAVRAKVALDGAASCSADAAAQMYSALMLLGGSSAHGASVATAELLKELGDHLRLPGLAGTLSTASCVDLCYASLLAPPEGSTARHPVDILKLVERCAGDAQALSTEGRQLLGLIAKALELLPWNGTALRSAEKLEALLSSQQPQASWPSSFSQTPTPRASLREPPAGCLAAAATHLAPHHREPLLASAARSQVMPPPGLDHPSSHVDDRGLAIEVPSSSSLSFGGASFRAGIFLASEIRDALSNISAGLAAAGVEHRLVLEGPLEAHLVLPRTSLPTVAPGHQAQGDVVLLWGSSVHFVTSGYEKLGDYREARPQLSPATKFQVATLRNAASESCAEVVVLPRWRLPGRGCSSLTADQGLALLGVLDELLMAQDMKG